MPTLREQLPGLYKELRKYAWSLTRNNTTADDLAQSACVRALASEESYDEARPLLPWLIAITWSAFMDMRRKWANDKLSVPLTEWKASTPARQEDFCECNDVLRLINALPAKQRLALAAVIGGLDHDEMARVLDVRREHIWKRVYAARQILSKRDASL